VDAALAAIAEGGLAAVAVVPLAERLGATKGSFYWHFPSREALVEAALAAWDHPTVRPVLDRVTRRRIDFAARLFQRLGFPRAEAKRRALLAYSAYLGHTQLVHATPQLLPQTQAAQGAYLDDVLAALTSPPNPR